MPVGPVICAQIEKEKEGTMDQQQSQKTGKRSDAQKLDRAREGYSAIPPAQPVGGAFGKEQEEKDRDRDEDSDE